MANKKKKNWVDFKTIKAQVSIEMVLERYGVLDGFKKSGKNLVGCCPIHKGSNPRQFSVDPERNIFNCFGNCKTGGNVLDFVALMEFNNKETVSIRKAGLLLQNWFLVEPQEIKETIVKEKEKRLQVDHNTPLTFDLKNLEVEHPFFVERGISPETINHFDLGYCSRGIMNKRIVIPIHDEFGRLVAYCGRAVNKKQIENEGKYKMPPDFLKSLEVYNLHQQKDKKLIVLVESFLSVFWLYQHGIENVVALMGSSLSDQQADLLIKYLAPPGRIILMFDADEDGDICTDQCLKKLSCELFVKSMGIKAYGRKPHQIKPEILEDLKWLLI
jgi:DNA primase